MILSTQNSLFKFKYLVNDVMISLVKITQQAAQRRKNQQGQGVNDIEDGSIDEDNRKEVEDLIQFGAVRAYEILTFLVNGLALPSPQKTFAWKIAGTESRDAVVITIGQKDWMADTVPTLVNEGILNVIKEYALREWYKSSGMIPEAQVHDQEYQNACMDLRRAARLRNKPASRPIQILP